MCTITHPYEAERRLRILVLLLGVHCDASSFPGIVSSNQSRIERRLICSLALNDVLPRSPN